MTSLAGFRQTLTNSAGRALGPFFRPPRLAVGFQPSRILVVKLCCLGDVLMATPALTLLRETFPRARLDLAVGTWSRPAVRNNPNLNEILDVGQLGAGRYPWRDYLGLVRRLRWRGYDLALVLERSIYTSLLPLLAGVPYRVGLDSEGRGFPFTTRIPCLPARHEANLYLEAALAATKITKASPRSLADLGQRRLEFYPSPDDAAVAQKMLRGMGRPLVAIHPGGAVNPGGAMLSKRWLPERFAAIANLLADRYGAEVLLTGGASDADAVRGVQSRLRRPARVLGCELTFSQLGAVLAACDLFLGNDTGPAHLAAAVGTRVVTIFGPTDPRVYGPYGGAGEAVWTEKACSPCFQRGGFPGCSHVDCLREVSVEAVWAAVKRQLALAGERHP